MKILYVMLKGIFTIEEISQLEALDIRGGHGGARDTNNGCNTVSGCACTSQTGCPNNAKGCGTNSDDEEEGGN